MPPGPFPNTSVTAVNVVAKGSSSGFNSNVELADFEGQGPLAWSCTKYNRGDFAMRISPLDPAASDANTLNRGFVDFTSAGDPALAENQTWRPSPVLGIAIPTARQNGPIDWQDGEVPFYPTAAISASSSGRGYDMVSGAFGNGNLDINTGRAGTHASSPEANFSFSVSWFPYDAGWIGGNVGSPDPATGIAQWNGAGQHSAGLVPSLMNWTEFPVGSGVYGGLGFLRLPGVNALEDGMVFTTSSHGNSDVNIVGVGPTRDEASGASGWVVTVREDSALTAEEVASGGQYQFEFVYVPFSAKNLVGGYINGTDGSALKSSGAYTLQRTAEGVYELSVPGKTASSGTLILQVADLEAETSVPFASRAFLSYEYNSQSGTFVIQSRKATTAEVSDLTDANFYFAWVDFASPLAPPDGPRLRATEPVIVANADSISAKEGNLAVSSDEPELLVTVIDQSNKGDYSDPTTGERATQALLGYFYDASTLALKRGPFFIMGNSRGGGQITRHDLKYNPVSRQYNVVGNARQYGENQTDVLMIARVNPTSVAGDGDPLVGVSVYDGLNNGTSYDDVSLAVSTKNGNFIVVGEHKVTGEGEGSYGALFSADGTALTPVPGRVDLLQGPGDEDDPDVAYLPGKDVFLYTSNIDAAPGGVDQLANKIVGSVIQTTADPDGNLRIAGPEQSLAIKTGPAQGHAASIENPFNGEIITAFDTGGNDVSTGSLSYFSIGEAPGYVFTEARSQEPYLAGAATGNPFRHQHPQIAVDRDSGVFVVGYQARASTVGLPNGYAFNVLDSTGAPLPSQLGAPYYLFDTPAGPTDTSPNWHNLRYSPTTDSFIAVTTAGANNARTVYLGALTVTSAHLPQVVPSLTIARQGADVTLSWPASASGYVLTSTPSLVGGVWSSVAQAAVQVGERLEVTVPISGNSYFRLER